MLCRTVYVVLLYPRSEQANMQVPPTGKPPCATNHLPVQHAGGYGKTGTMFEYAKRLADYVQGHWVSRKLHPGFDPHKLTDSLLSVAFYDQMVVLEKGPHPRPMTAGHGTFMIPYGSRTLNPAKLEEFKGQLAPSLVPQPAAKG